MQHFFSMFFLNLQALNDSKQKNISYKVKLWCNVILHFFKVTQNRQNSCLGETHPYMWFLSRMAEMEKDGCSGRAACADFSQLCYFLPFLCASFAFLWYFCTIFFIIYCTYFCANYSESKFSVCYFVSFFHLCGMAKVFRCFRTPYRHIEAEATLHCMFSTIPKGN